MFVLRVRSAVLDVSPSLPKAQKQEFPGGFVVVVVIVPAFQLYFLFKTVGGI